MKLNMTQVLFIEALIVIGLLGILVSISVNSHSKTVKVVTISEALSLANILKQDIYVHYAYYGEWPDATQLKKIPDYEKEFEGISKIEVLRGSFFLTYGDKYQYMAGKVLAFRKAQFINEPGTPVNWLCGYQKAPSGMTVDIDNRTTIKKKYMPKGCK